MSAPHSDAEYTKMSDASGSMSSEAWMKMHGNGSDIYISYDYDHAVRAQASGCDVMILVETNEMRTFDVNRADKYVQKLVHIRDDPCCFGMCIHPAYEDRIVGRVARRYVIMSPRVTDKRLFEFMPHMRRIERHIDTKSE